MSLKRIAAVLGAECKTIRRWLRTGGAAPWRKPQRGGLLGSYRDYLDRRGNEGCRNAAQLWRERVTRGFPDRPGAVRHWAGRRRKSQPRAANAPAMQVVPNQSPSARQVARRLMSDDIQSQADQSFGSRLLVQLPGLGACVDVAKRLNQVPRRHGNETLEEGLGSAAGTALKDFAVSLRRDLHAVQAALDLPWTTSPADGQINRLKTLKRSMYGRAGFNLLRARVRQTV